MAVVLEDANAVWQKVKGYLDHKEANPAAAEVFNDLRKYLASQGLNPQLQFIPFSEAQAIANGGGDLTGAACKLYGVYAKTVRVTGATAAFFAVHAAATNGATTTTVTTKRFLAAGQYYAEIMPSGIAVETGLTVSSATAVGGATESTTPDGAEGFVIIGAA